MCIRDRFGDGQRGSRLAGALKYNPFEPLSMKLLGKDTPLKTVVNSPTELAGYAVTAAGVLLDWVPIPSTRFPLTEDTPPKGTPGSCTSTPLLSCLLYTSPSPRDRTRSRMPSSA